ncbi:protein PLASTID MOVEMENT IMPAIRED 2-like [Typha latifolia]|uniref:protein PLASTID MOVEMENT IMPAIRED 2-like n=1 Tax=Typha latifolia TaxID=4733 RepID=UPI003C3075E8
MCLDWVSLIQMDNTKSESTDGFEAAISLSCDRIEGRESKMHKSQISILEDLPSKTGKLHLAKMDISRLHEAKTSAEKEKAHAEPELFRVRSTARELARKIEEANAKAMTQRSQLQSIHRSGTRKKEFAEVMLELDNVKKELSRLKHDITSALEAKAQAEKEIEASTSKTQYHSLLVDELKKEIEEANEEHVLVELARIEAGKEWREVEAQREAAAGQFAKNMDAAKKRIEELRREINRAKALETKLATTNSDVTVLQNEMELTRTMQTNSRMKKGRLELQSAKHELASIKEEGFQLMSSMDQIREDKMHLSEEANRLKRLEKKADSNVQYLSAELLSAKSRLESASVADERAKLIISSLLAALQQLRAETDAAKREKELVDEETRCTREEIKKTDIEISSLDARLQAAAQLLKLVKASEAAALKKLKDVADRTMKARADSIYRRFALSISKCEYDYLFRSAVAVQVVADKKVAAAQLWIEALKAAEKEIVLRTEFAESEIKGFRAMEEQKLCEMEKSLFAKKAMEEEISKCKGETSALQLAAVPAIKSLRKKGIPTASGRTNMSNVSASSGNRNTRFRSFTIKRRKVVPNLVKLIRDRRSGKKI